jgi:biopolymer transport protein ExbD
MTITSQGQYAIDKSPIGGSSVGALVAVLTPLAHQDTMLVISADASATHQTVINAMEAARRSGLSKITFAAQAAQAPGF